jgi:hypothetical protein
MRWRYVLGILRYSWLQNWYPKQSQSMLSLGMQKHAGESIMCLQAQLNVILDPEYSDLLAEHQ